LNLLSSIKHILRWKPSLHAYAGSQTARASLPSMVEGSRERELLKNPSHLTQ